MCYYQSLAHRDKHFGLCCVVHLWFCVSGLSVHWNIQKC